jgi:hypothetical protein
MKTIFRRTILFCAVWFGCAALAAEKLELSKFNEGSTKPFEGGGSLSDKHGGGKKTLALENGKFIIAKPENGLPTDWSKYDLVTFNMFNPTGKHVKFYIQVRDNNPDSNYWTWHNRYTALAPGKNEVQFAVADLWRGEIRRG